ncbi:putative sulfite oxidase, mitochondrial [Pseudocercospora fuligena]|uniref:Putative sulfite oxidase, mitochondrial n=1 Tax=Pseudocercospora fuligena TaxID=685502 RepID=A0A8H6RF23_9PEZI|nr:putative sulfite oxidase, mitochondrial [Pseudocercospora fuligena]
MSTESKEPVNREPPLKELIEHFITPVNEGYDRNHSGYPQIDGESHRVVVDGAVSNNLSLSKVDLQSLPQHVVVCALQCAGNRRHTMRTKIKEVSGVDWFDGAVMNCKWKGPLLCDVLDKAGISLPDEDRESAHVAFASYEAECQDDSWYGASISLDRATSREAEVILALEMNNEPLTISHGFPVRVVTPGIAGARSVKWLNQITVQKKESQNHYQQRDYKVLPPEATDAESAEKYWDSTPAIMEMPVNSVIAWPETGSKVH